MTEPTTDIWTRVDEAIDTDPLKLRGIVAELLARAEHAEAELSSRRDHNTRWELERQKRTEAEATVERVTQYLDGIEAHCSANRRDVPPWVASVRTALDGGE